MANASNQNTPKANKIDFRKYTEQIWLAGLGAFAKAEEEGSKVFDSLVKLGQELETKTNEVVGEVKNTVTGHLTQTASTTREKLDDVVTQTTSKLSESGQKTTEQLVGIIENLHTKIDSLLQEVNRLKQQEQQAKTDSTPSDTYHQK